MKTSFVALALGFPIAVNAAPIELVYSGTVSSLTYADCQTYSSSGSCRSWSFTSISTTDFVLGSTISVGSAFSGRFLFDPDAPLTAISSDGYQAIHLRSVPLAKFTAGQVNLPNPQLPMSGAGGFSVVDGRFGYDSFYLQSSFSGPDFFASVNLHLQDSTGSAYDGFEVPRAVDLADFNANVFRVGFLRRSDGDQVQLDGNLTTASIVTPGLGSVSVPEPGTALLAMAGLVAAGALRVSRRPVAG